MDRWILRDEILKSLSQWYLILAFIVIGALLGFGISYLRPAPYQAIKDLYVGIDVKRVNEMEYIIPLAEEEPLNLDDYKNWQLKQVADILTSDSVLLTALEDLQAKDETWNQISLGDFRKALDIYWYDTGVWQLKVTYQNKDQAISGVESWANAGYEKISELTEISQQNSELDQQIWSINLAIRDLKIQRAQFKSFSEKGQEWSSLMSEIDPQEIIPADTYQGFSDWIQVYLSYEGYWEHILEGFPERSQPAGTVLSWLEICTKRGLIALDEVESQLRILEKDRQVLLPAYHEYLDASLGLSANLVLQPNSSLTDIYRAYQSDTYLLGGAFLGLLAWLLYAVSRISGIRERHG